MGCNLVPNLFLAPTLQCQQANGEWLIQSPEQSCPYPELQGEEDCGHSHRAPRRRPQWLSMAFPSLTQSCLADKGLRGWVGTCIYLPVVPSPWGQRAGTLRGPTRSSACSAPPRPWQCHSRRCHGMLRTVSLPGCWPPEGQQGWGRVSERAEGQTRRVIKAGPGKREEKVQERGGQSEKGECRKGAGKVGAKSLTGGPSAQAQPCTPATRPAHGAGPLPQRALTCRTS